MASRIRVAIGSILGLLLCFLPLGYTQLSTIPLRLGGLPHLYPPTPLFDCSLLNNDCQRCTDQPNCMFCWGGTTADPTLGTQTLTGLCTQLGDPIATQQCPANNKFFRSSVCSSVLASPGCAYDYFTDSCQIIYPFNPSITQPSYVQFSQIWFGCMIGFTVLGVLVIWTGSKWQPRAGRWEGPPSEDLDMYSWLVSLLSFAVQLSALAVNNWSTTIQFPPLDGHLNYGLFGRFETLNSAPAFYACDSKYVHPDASQTACKVLAAGSILTFVLEVIPCIVWLFSCTLRIFAERWFKANKELWWRVECTACFLCCIGLSVWVGVCHQLIKESMLAPFNGGPYARLDLWHSWRLNCCTVAISITSTIMVAFSVNRSDESQVRRFGGICGCTNRISPERAQTNVENAAAEVQLTGVPEGIRSVIDADEAASRDMADRKVREAEEAIAELRRAQQEKEMRDAQQGVVAAEENPPERGEGSDVPRKESPDLPDPNFVPPDQTMLDPLPPYSPPEDYTVVAASSSIAASTVTLHTPNNFYNANSY